MVVTRVEIADHIENAFDGDRALSANELLASARPDGARREVLRVLECLPGTYSDLRDLWPDPRGARWRLKSVHARSIRRPECRRHEVDTEPLMMENR
jgi:hypothetical protein